MWEDCHLLEVNREWTTYWGLDPPRSGRYSTYIFMSNLRHVKLEKAYCIMQDALPTISTPSLRVRSTFSPHFLSRYYTAFSDNLAWGKARCWPAADQRD